ncbi:MAG: type II secretion system secretin GspD [Geminicoccaceae bacterium]
MVFETSTLYRGCLMVTLLAPMLAGCVDTPPRSPIDDTVAEVSFAPPPATGTTGRSPLAAGVGRAQPPEPKLQPQIFPGRQSVPRPPAAGAERSGEGVQLNFEQAEVRDVIKVILGDLLHQSYTVDSDVQGQITLSSSAPMADAVLLAILETVLRANGATLVQAGAGAYRIMPVDHAIGQSEVLPLGGRPVEVRPGYGITIVPLRNIAATSAAQFIQPLVASPEDIRIDPGRNAILFSGTGIERQNVVQTLEDLDVDWMAGKSIGLFPLQRTNAEAVIPELQAIFAPFDPTGAEPSLIHFLPLARMKAVLAVAGDAQQIREVGNWVTRLDRGQAVGTQFYVYYLKHGVADDVAKLLNEAFSESAASSSGPSLGSGSTALSGGQQQGGEAAPQEGAASHDATTVTPAETPPSNGPVKAVASKANNSLLIRATPADYERVEATLARLDTAPWQVLIEATIAEVTLTDQLRYGVQYYLESSSLAAGFVSASQTSLLPATTTPGFNLLFTPGSSNITIDALSQLTDVRVLSSPSVVVQDNSEAVLTVGQEVPIQTQQQQSSSTSSNIINSIEYRDTGVILQVRPRINSNQAVSLEIAQEVSRVDSSSSSTTSNALTPTFTQRKIKSRVNVQSGQTVVLGGLIQDSESRGKSRIPVLGDIPALGALFGSTSDSNTRTELIVFLTPRVLRNPEDARDVSEELRARLKVLRPPEASMAPPQG